MQKVAQLLDHGLYSLHFLSSMHLRFKLLYDSLQSSLFRFISCHNFFGAHIVEECVCEIVGFGRHCEVVGLSFDNFFHCHNRQMHNAIGCVTTSLLVFVVLKISGAGVANKASEAEQRTVL